MKKAKLQFVTQRMEGKYPQTDYCIQWEQADGTVRIPEECKKEFPFPHMFVAAGKVYPSLDALRAEKLDEYGHHCRDIYGREVFAEWQRFPCFDSYDYLYENRYYRWFYINEGDKVTCVYYEDQQKKLTVIEDVCKIPESWWKKMQELDFGGNHE